MLIFVLSRTQALFTALVWYQRATNTSKTLIKIVKSLIISVNSQTKQTHTHILSSSLNKLCDIVKKPLWGCIDTKNKAPVLLLGPESSSTFIDFKQLGGFEVWLPSELNCSSIYQTENFHEHKEIMTSCNRIQLNNSTHENPSSTE